MMIIKEERWLVATARQRGAAALILVGAEPSYDETEEREKSAESTSIAGNDPWPASAPAWPPSPRH